eukprot:scaffold14801_cov105-Isochrysis_galbana.AAC.9
MHIGAHARSRQHAKKKRARCRRRQRQRARKEGRAWIESGLKCQMNLLYAPMPILYNATACERGARARMHMACRQR